MLLVVTKIFIVYRWWRWNLEYQLLVMKYICFEIACRLELTNAVPCKARVIEFEQRDKSVFDPRIVGMRQVEGKI